MSARVVYSRPPPAASSPSLESPPAPTTETATHRVRLTAWRIAGGVVLTALAFLAIGYAPYAVETYAAAQFGVPPPINPGFLLGAGAFVAILAGASFAAKPTRAWGPVRIVSAAVSLAYLGFLLQSPVYSLSLHAFSFSVAYGRILELFLIPPIIGLGAGIVTTIGDFRHPGERTRIMFP